MSVAIIDYGSGNLHSAAKAFERAARGSEQPQKIVVTRDPDTVFRADRIVLPGVGAFADCRKGLDSLDGMVDAMTEAVGSKARPFFGICVGMQLMADVGREDVETRGLGWIPGAVERITPNDPNLPVPHMGWNTLTDMRDHALFNGLGPEPHVYFVHSYALKAEKRDHVAARCDYGGKFVAAVARDNLFGAQFHPEKSQKAGLLLLANFLRWKP